MNTIKVKIVAKNGAIIPEYATKNSAGFDLRVTKVITPYYTSAENVDEKGFIIPPMCRVLVGTDLFIELPEGKEMQVRPRSGLVIKEGITVLNSPGTIDADYRGEIGIILYNSDHHYKRIQFGDRVAQGVICSVDQVEWEKVQVLSDTERGEGGFGSSGMK